MFRNAELGRKVSKAEYKKAVPQLRFELVQLQRRLMNEADFSVIIVVSGVNSAGRSETINLLNEWMDPRWLITEAYSVPSPEELERPPYWRYWRDLPPKGRIGLFLNSWYAHPMLERFSGEMRRAEFDRELDRVVSFETLHADDGVLILKLWMHLKRDLQKKRLTELSEDPMQSWRVGELDWKLCRHYDRYLEIAGDTVGRTSTARAPWTIVEGADPRYRALEVGRVIRDALARRLDAAATTSGDVDDGPADSADPKDTVASSLEPALERTVLSTLDMSLTASKKDYESDLVMLQGRVHGLAREAREKKFPVIALFEGWDAAGKGGAVRRLTAAMDARDYRVIPIAAPTDEERAHHYLWRFWRHLGRAGRMTIFDRSWYGRVLVERVEGFATRDEWSRAYAEINDFEGQLTDHGIVLLKFWIHITSDEQFRRFRQRESTPYKSWKLTEEDWRNREKWNLYEQAVEDMVARTSTVSAPWTLVEGNSKRYARLKVLRTVADALDEALNSRSKKKKKKKRKKK